MLKPLLSPRLFNPLTELSIMIRLLSAKSQIPLRWFEAGSKLVADRFEAGRRPASNPSATKFEPASVMEIGFK